MCPAPTKWPAAWGRGRSPLKGMSPPVCGAIWTCFIFNPGDAMWREETRAVAGGPVLSAAGVAKLSPFDPADPFSQPAHPAALYVFPMKRRRMFRAVRWAGRLVGVTLVLAFTRLCLRWAEPHTWLKVLLGLWGLTFLPAGWVGGSMIAHWIARRIYRRGMKPRAHI